MKIMKLSSILLLSLFFMSAFIPEASARKYCRSRSSFGLSFNVGTPGYVVAPAPVVAAPVVAPAPVYPYPAPAYVAAPGYAAPGYAAYPSYPYSYYSAPVVVGRPGPAVYVQPGFSYSHTHWRR